MRHVLVYENLSLQVPSSSVADPRDYENWFNDFQIFLKEGVMTDNENQEQLLRLMRYHSTKATNSVSLDEYIKSMKEGQKKIYFISGA